MARRFLCWFTEAEIVKAFAAGASTDWLAHHTGLSCGNIETVIRNDYLMRKQKPRGPRLSVDEKMGR